MGAGVGVGTGLGGGMVPGSVFPTYQTSFTGHAAFTKVEDKEAPGGAQPNAQNFQQHLHVEDPRTPGMM